MKKHLLSSIIFCLGFTSLHAEESMSENVIQEMKRVADWQINHPSKHQITHWTQAPYYLGLSHLYQVSGDEKYLGVLEAFGEWARFEPGSRVTHADDHAVLQAWLDLHQLQPSKGRLHPTVAQFPKILKALPKEKPASVTGGSFTWCWCDALFMSPPVWAQLSHITKEPKYLEWADREWWTSTDVLYDPQHSLYYRDNRFFDRRTETGRKVFWARGNGWVIGGLTRMLDYLPAGHPSRERYLALYHDMMYALLKLQNADGLWRTSLLDPEGEVGESSGTAFFVFGMAWGVNRGLLPAETFRPAMDKGWKALCANVQPDGMLGYVQKIGDAPGAATSTATEVYGTGAFLLAGSEIARLLDPQKQRKNIASFKGVKLPTRFLREKPRVHVRVVPERSDDFAWENDLIAFRSYGPALRAGDEDSGFDAWFKRVPYPIIDKWYKEDLTNLEYAKGNKTYHQDQGEGYDGYKVGNSRGCGGISIWSGGKLQNSNTYVGYKIITQTPDRAVFDLHYASKLDGKALREIKRITLVMGQRLFQCESRFTLDGKPLKTQVAIGLKHQTGEGKTVASPKAGSMQVWETLSDSLGLGQGIVVAPESVIKMIDHTDVAGNKHSLCIASTDDTGYIRWFAGYGWQGQGVITSAEIWGDYVKQFAKKCIATPFADHSKTLKLPAEVESNSSATLLKRNGGWCWYQGPRAIVTRSGKLVFTSISGDTYGGYDAGDLYATSWDLKSKTPTHFELHDKFQCDDHDAAGLLERADGTLLAVYGKHGSDQLQRWRTTKKGDDISAWVDEKNIQTDASYTYSNVFSLSGENGRIYNFSRTLGYNPNCTYSDDNGNTWKYGWRLLHWAKDAYKDDPKYSGTDGSRPYLRYASNGKDAIHFVTTEDHPRAYDNSIYHGFYRAGKLHDSLGHPLSEPTAKDAKLLGPKSFTRVFEGGKDKVAWTADLELDDKGFPYTAFSVQIDGAEARGKHHADFGNDHRYGYARFDGKQWHAYEIAYAGTKLYTQESDYTGLIALDPDDPNTVVISTNADPVTGKPLISKSDQKRHWEIYRGNTADGGKTWKWTPITAHSTADNLRPNIPENPGGKRIIIWCRGDLKTYTNFRLDIYGLVEVRSISN